MSRKYRYSEKNIKQALKEKEMLCLKGLLAMWQYNPDLNREYTIEVQNRLNGFVTSFNHNENEIMSSLANQYQQKGFLSENQLRVVRRRILKYAPFLTQLANMEPDVKLPTLEAPDPKDHYEEGRKMMWYKCVAGKDGVYENPAIMYARSGKTVLCRIFITEDDVRPTWLPLKCIELSIQGDEKDPAEAYVSIPKWLCEKNRIPVDMAMDDDEVKSIISK